MKYKIIFTDIDTGKKNYAFAGSMITALRILVERSSYAYVGKITKL